MISCRPGRWSRREPIPRSGTGPRDRMTPRTGFTATTILTVRRDGRVAMAGDGQVTLESAVMKHGARKVRRVVRYVSPWSVLKVSVLFYACLWVILTIASVILWRLAVASGTIENFEKFVARLFGETSFTIDGREIFRASTIAGMILVFAGTGFTVLMSLLFNVICDITGGVRFTLRTKIPASSVVTDADAVYQASVASGEITFETEVGTIVIAAADTTALGGRQAARKEALKETDAKGVAWVRLAGWK